MSLMKRAFEAGDPLSSQELSVTTVATALTVPANVLRAVVSVTGANARYRVDSGTPTASSGHQLAVGGSVELFGSAIGKALFIAETGTSVVFVTYYVE